MILIILVMGDDRKKKEKKMSSRILTCLVRNGSYMGLYIV